MTSRSIVAAAHGMQARCRIPYVEKPAHRFVSGQVVWFRESASCVMKVTIRAQLGWQGITPSYMIELPDTRRTIKSWVLQTELATEHDGFSKVDAIYRMAA
jgi:hypothetical protein